MTEEDDIFNAKSDALRTADQMGPQVTELVCDVLPGAKVGPERKVDGPRILLLSAEEPEAKEDEALKLAYAYLKGLKFKVLVIGSTIQRFGRIKFYDAGTSGWGALDPGTKVIRRCVIDRLSPRNMRRLERLINVSRREGENSPEWVRAFADIPEPPYTPNTDTGQYPNTLDEALEDDDLGGFDAKADAIEHAPKAKLIWKRVYAHTSQKEPVAVEIMDEVDVDGTTSNVIAIKVIRYFVKEAERRQVRGLIRTVYAHFVSLPPYIMYSARKDWPAGRAYTDRFILTGLGVAELRAVNKHVTAWLYSPSRMEALESVNRLLEDDDEDATFNAKQDAMAVELPRPRVRITRSFMLPDDEDSTSEWVDEEGVEMAPDEFDDEDATVVSKTVKFLWDAGAVHASSSHHGTGDWYSTEWGTVNYRTGEQEEKSYHLVDFTPAEEEAVYDGLRQKHNRRRGIPEALVATLLEDDGDEAFDAKQHAMASAVRSVHIVGRRWFRRSVGRTYYKAYIYVNGEQIAVIGPWGGYSNQFADDGVTWLEQNGYIPRRSSVLGGYLQPHTHMEQLGIEYRETVTDVPRKADL